MNKLTKMIADGIKDKLRGSKDFADFTNTKGKNIDDVDLSDIREFNSQREEAGKALVSIFKGELTTKATVKEMLSDPDFEALLRQNTRKVFLDEKEPTLFLSEMVAEKLPMADNEDSITFLESGAFIAEEMSATQEYPMAGENAIEKDASLAVGKQGLAFAMSDSLANSNNFQLFARYVKKTENAINRLVESGCFNVIESTPQVIFDNRSTIATNHTTGLAANDTLNYSTGYYDILDVCSKLVSNEREATHLLYNPLAYMIFLLDPTARTTFVHEGQLGAGLYNQAPAMDQQVNMFFNLAAVPLNYVLWNNSEVIQSLPATQTTDLFIIDKARALYLAEKGSMSTGEADVFFRDAKAFKACRKTRSGLMDKGLGVAKMTGIRIERNYDPTYTVRSFTA